ncbi:MAG: hypothetical protein ACYDCC_15965 [Actinomycetota bacterium]
MMRSTWFIKIVAALSFLMIVPSRGYADPGPTGGTYSVSAPGGESSASFDATLGTLSSSAEINQQLPSTMQLLQGGQVVSQSYSFLSWTNRDGILPNSKYVVSVQINVPTASSESPQANSANILGPLPAMDKGGAEADVIVWIKVETTHITAWAEKVLACTDPSSLDGMSCESPDTFVLTNADQQPVYTYPSDAGDSLYVRTTVALQSTAALRDIRSQSALANAHISVGPVSLQRVGD